MNTKTLEIGGWIFANAIFGKRAYKILGIKQIGDNGAEIKTSYGTATFSILIGDNNWRYATYADIS